MTINKKQEILFLYDVKDANPNGDPLDGNKPRIDEENNINLVTDVRLKRTIRDYLYEYKGYNGTNDKDIFVREIKKSDGINVQEAKDRAQMFGKKNEDIKENLIKKCIDIRLFGGVLALKGSNDHFTGPVQFKMGRSLHPVEIKHIKGTGAFAGKDTASQKTFREEYILPYSLIAFHGIVNEAAAQHTNLTEEDIKLLLEGMWHGTKNLISRSKFGHMPRLLIRITYKEKGFFIGDLDQKIKITKPDNLYKIRKIDDLTLDISDLVNTLNKEENKQIDEIEKIEYKCDSSLEKKLEIPENWVKMEI